MEDIQEYLKSLHKMLHNNVEELIGNAKETLLKKGYEDIESMYEIPQIQGVKYEYCIMIPYSNTYASYCAPYKLPEDEVVIANFPQSCTTPNNMSWCILLTNYGRFLPSLPIYTDGGMYTSFAPRNSTEVYCQNNSGDTRPITLLEPLSYKLPKLFLEAFCAIQTIQARGHILNSYSTQKDLESISNKSTQTLQSLNKELYMIMGKWREYIKPHTGLEVQTFPEKIKEYERKIKELQSEIESLKEANEVKEDEIETLKIDTKGLENKLTPLVNAEKWKSMFITHMKKSIKMNDTLFNSQESIKKILDSHTYIDTRLLEQLLEESEEAKEYKKYQQLHQKFKGVTDLKKGQRAINKNVSEFREDFHRKFNES